MFHSVRHGRAAQYPHKWLLVTGRIFLECLRTKFAATASILLLSTTSFAVTANAVEANVRNDFFSALSDYVQLIETAPKLVANTPQDSNGVPRQEPNDDAYAALRAFTERIGANQPESIKGQPKVAEPQTLMEWLNGKGSSEAPPPATPPKAPAAKGTRSSAPVEAHVVGSQACATCHSAQVAEFEKTQMGKIGRTQKGKFECENCHGPGSAHVKAGGGRGVGGILSFGADDPRSVDERNGICLACHRKGERNYWAGSVHETRDVACTDCHTVMKNVSRKHNLKTTVEAETCFQCHKIQRAQVQYSSHMPIREGKLTCTNCHNPHGTVTEKLIRQASINDNCYTCHAEKRGPFLWPHAPVNENCLNCHTAARLELRIPAASSAPAALQ